MKKYVLLSISFLLIFCHPTNTSNKQLNALCGNTHYVRHTALIIASLMLTGGGIYLVTQKYEKKLERFLNTLTSISLLGCGIGGILIGEEIIDSIERGVLDIKQSAVQQIHSQPAKV